MKLTVFPVLIFLICGFSGGQLEDSGGRGIVLSGVSNNQNVNNPNKSTKKRFRPQFHPEAFLDHGENDEIPVPTINTKGLPIGRVTNDEKTEIREREKEKLEERKRQGKKASNMERKGKPIKHPPQHSKSNPHRDVNDSTIDPEEEEKSEEKHEKQKRRPPHSKPRNSPRISPDIEESEGEEGEDVKSNKPRRPNPKPNSLTPRLAPIGHVDAMTTDKQEKESGKQSDSGELENDKGENNEEKLIKPKPKPGSLLAHPKPNNSSPRRFVVDAPRGKRPNEMQSDSGENVNEDDSEERIKKPKKRPRPKPKHKKSHSRRQSDENEADNDENQEDSGENEDGNENQERRGKTKKRKHHKYKNLPRDFNTTYKKSYNKGAESFTMNSHTHPEN